MIHIKWSNFVSIRHCIIFRHYQLLSYWLMGVSINCSLFQGWASNNFLRFTKNKILLHCTFLTSDCFYSPCWKMSKRVFLRFFLSSNFLKTLAAVNQLGGRDCLEWLERNKNWNNFVPQTTNVLIDRTNAKDQQLLRTKRPWLGGNVEESFGNIRFPEFEASTVAHAD